MSNISEVEFAIGSEGIAEVFNCSGFNQSIILPHFKDSVSYGCGSRLGESLTLLCSAAKNRTAPFFPDGRGVTAFSEFPSLKFPWSYTIIGNQSFLLFPPSTPGSKDSDLHKLGLKIYFYQTYLERTDLF